MIITPTLAEILLEEFMKPCNISAWKLARAIHVPVSKIQNILDNKGKILMTYLSVLADTLVSIINISLICKMILSCETNS